MIDGTTTRANGAAALQEYDVSFQRRSVLEVAVRDEPGALGTLADVIADSGGDIEAAYLTTRGTVSLALNDLADATEIRRRMEASS